MAPPPNFVVIMNDAGKEIGGSNHYCIICCVPTPRNPPAKQPIFFSSPLIALLTHRS